jgi:meso-butanediol dehydrogenase/(S,S)-butanediol dehydrogenase/diacetyl reductase
MADLSGKVAVVTGAGSGIGRAAAQRFLRSGASIVAVDISAAGLQWCDGLENVVPVVGSVADRATNAAMVDASLSGFGRLDIAYLNAGIAAFGAISDPSMDAFDSIVAVNLRGTVLGLKAVSVPMIEQRSGAVVVTASTSGMFGDIGMWAYNATKAALINLVRSTGSELAAWGVRVNAVCPGPTLSDGAAGSMANQPGAQEAVASKIPMRRWAHPDEIAAAVEFLASDDASFVTATTLVADGGLTALTNAFDVPDLAPLLEVSGR